MDNLKAPVVLMRDIKAVKSGSGDASSLMDFEFGTETESHRSLDR
ncbi:MAG: hypothetical protein CM1200mP41_13020 [Gammaproteobacteria bacterium]|nr:MAG: hypothetical protein CM1200mP41_13020 [Gammaproteobacteria bacterium]